MGFLEKFLEKHAIEKSGKGAIAYLAAIDYLMDKAPEIGQSILKELKDERSHVKLIASENFSSLAVQLAMGNLLTDKYAEGYAGHRFYAGCENVDSIEERGQKLLKEIFGCDHAYVQPHSGADANMVAFWSILIQRVQNPEIEKLGKKKAEELTEEEYQKIRQAVVGQKLMGMSLNSGGHLTHGYLHNISSKMFHAVSYDVDPKTELLDYGKIAEMAKKEKPTILLAGYSAHPRRINFAKMREIADSVGAVLMSDIAHFAGLVAGKVFQGEENPIPYSHMVTSTTHKTLRGPRGGIVMCQEEFGEIVDKGCPLVLGGPLPHVLAAKAIAFQEANTSEFQDYSRRVVDNARALGERFLERGIRLVTGGTENHMIIADLSKIGITGRQAESVLREAKFTLNRNAIPFDKNGPWYTSGIRVGTPATTSLGMGPDEMREIADAMIDVLEATSPTTVERTGKASLAKYKVDPSVIDKAHKRVGDLLAKFPLYPELELIDGLTVKRHN